MKNIWLAWYRHFRGHVTIPQHLINHHPKLIHFSDTPQLFYPEMARIITILKPTVLIHTGDIADHVKLEIQPSKIDLFQRALRAFRRAFTPKEPCQIFLCMGNHDNRTFIEAAFPEAEIIPEQKMIQIDQLALYLSHYGPTQPIDHVTHYFYGHAAEPISNTSSPPFYLNGIENIHIIDLITNEITAIPYPSYLNTYRLNRYKTGY